MDCLFRSLWQFPFHSVTQYPLWVTKFIISHKAKSQVFYKILKIIFLKNDA